MSGASPPSGVVVGGGADGRRRLLVGMCKTLVDRSSPYRVCNAIHIPPPLPPLQPANGPDPHLERERGRPDPAAAAGAGCRGGRHDDACVVEQGMAGLMIGWRGCGWIRLVSWAIVSYRTVSYPSHSHPIITLFGWIGGGSILGLEKEMKGHPDRFGGGIQSTWLAPLSNRSRCGPNSHQSTPQASRTARGRRSSSARVARPGPETDTQRCRRRRRNGTHRGVLLLLSDTPFIW